ncbi:MAG: hypothetical protein ACRD3I_14970, partial [Terriglobales bacterium]
LMETADPDEQDRIYHALTESSHYTEKTILVFVDVAFLPRNNHSSIENACLLCARHTRHLDGESASRKLTHYRKICERAICEVRLGIIVLS